jgi:hypothetical protein
MIFFCRPLKSRTAIKKLEPEFISDIKTFFQGIHYFISVASAKRVPLFENNCFLYRVSKRKFGFNLNK